jgi:hypothetical protein
MCFKSAKTAGVDTGSTKEIADSSWAALNPADVLRGFARTQNARSGLIARIIAALLVACLFALTAAAQDYKSLLGKWQMTSETDGDPVNWTLVIKDVNGKPGVFLTLEDAEQPAKGVVYEGGVLKFKAPYEGEDYDVELKLAADKLEGTWSGAGDSGKTSGTRM